MDEVLEARLGALASRHRHLQPMQKYGPRFLDQPDGRRILNFSANDYLGFSMLAYPPYDDFSSQPSSRLLAGDTSGHHALEAELAAFMGWPMALLFTSGYMANLGLLSTVAQRGDVIIMDKFCHASLVDGALLSRAQLVRYSHLDMQALERELIRHAQVPVKWVVTESLFSMDGDAPDFSALAGLKKKYGFYLLVDEAHAVGVYGQEGRGLLDEAGMSSIADMLTFTLSKSFALQGGVVLGSPTLRDTLCNRCRPLIYTTAMPWSHIQDLPARLLALRSAHVQRRKLQELSMELADRLGSRRRLWSPIQPLIIGEGDKTRRLASRLQEAGILCPAILPPTVPAHSARLRISLNACHEREDILHLCSTLAEIQTAMSGDAEGAAGGYCGSVFNDLFWSTCKKSLISFLSNSVKRNS